MKLFRKKIKSADDPKLDEAFNKGLITEGEQLRLKFERSKERYADFLKRDKKKK